MQFDWDADSVTEELTGDGHGLIDCGQLGGVNDFIYGDGRGDAHGLAKDGGMDMVAEFAEGEHGEGQGLEECRAEGLAGEEGRGDALGLIVCEGSGVVERDDIGEL